LLVVAFGGELSCSDAKRGVPTPGTGVVEPGTASAAGATGGDAAAGADSDAGPPEGVPDAPFEPGPLCNGTAKLCEKSYSSLAFLGSHLSTASDASWPTQTQGRTLTEQLLIGGVRALELELHSNQGDLAVCEGKCSAGSESLPSVLREIGKFVQENPTDVLTVVLRSALPASDVAQAFEDQGLVMFTYSQAAHKPWPTLRQMIDAQQTLVVFLDQLPPDMDSGDAGADAGVRTPPDTGTSAPSWMHALSDWAWETAATEGADCTVLRGNAKAPLAILNHYTPGEAAGDDTLIAAHTPEVVAARLTRCQDDRKQLPNFVFVDFADVGDPNGGVQIANGLR
jgi:hypothetical protein